MQPFNPSAVLAPFAGLEAQISAGVQSLLPNAVAIWNGGPAFGVIFDQGLDDSYMPDTVSASRLTVAMCVANAPGIAEGERGLVVDGEPYIVTSPVIPDAGGWATFAVMPQGGA
ncbi:MULTISPECIES: hypothetical protein [Delftia]|uniref:Uncharacterized protein n=1 Tax=Delftia lacustris TaxID=558537 RepID=A0A7T3DHB5_9BURK|nr:MULTISPECIES: hypothetical protein [Delftia]EPD40856.1 hypothetical protein HMPREF9702_03425 [Delftia acidovorans CCUG 15835]QPS83295.1 hypothetical protein I6G47_09595 [Delftia lacustris]